jgi:hypothetical protein
MKPVRSAMPGRSAGAAETDIVVLVRRVVVVPVGSTQVVVVERAAPQHTLRRPHITGDETPGYAVVFSQPPGSLPVSTRHSAA